MQETIFCVDSDGCAMDTMTYKHQLFFGPLAADVFGIDEKRRAVFLAEWDRINLYSRTRGVNRFVGLVMGLEFAGVTDIDALKKWVETTASLSNASLEAQVAHNSSPDLQRALLWSYKVNQGIQTYDGEALAFSGVQESLVQLKKLGKVFVVSSANKEAVEEEWNDQGLMPYVDDLYCQDRGKKEDVLAMLVGKGYEPNRILMVGDSPGDLAAAKQNATAFFPILVGKEAASWQKLRDSVAQQFASGQFTQADQEELETAFWENLKK